MISDHLDTDVRTNWGPLVATARAACRGPIGKVADAFSWVPGSGPSPVWTLPWTVTSLGLGKFVNSVGEGGKAALGAAPKAASKFVLYLGIVATAVDVGFGLLGE